MSLLEEIGFVLLGVALIAAIDLAIELITRGPTRTQRFIRRMWGDDEQER